MMREFEHVADRADPAIHHIGRRYDIGSGIGLVQRLFGQYIECAVIFDIAIIVDQPVLAVAGIWIKRDIGQYAYIVAQRIFHRFGGPAHQIVGIEGFFPVIAALLCRRVGKQGKAGDAKVTRFACPLDDAVDRPA